LDNNPERANVDRSGYFSVYDGKLARPVVYGTGGMEGDSPRQAILRRILRERKPEANDQKD